MEVDEFKLAKDTGRALQAEGLVNSDLLTEGFDNLEKAYIELWRQTRPDEELAREKLYVAINVVGKVRQHLQTIIADGKLAEHQLAELSLRRKRS